MAVDHRTNRHGPVHHVLLHDVARFLVRRIGRHGICPSRRESRGGRRRRSGVRAIGRKIFNEPLRHEMVLLGQLRHGGDGVASNSHAVSRNFARVATETVGVA